MIWSIKLSQLIARLKTMTFIMNTAHNFAIIFFSFSVGDCQNYPERPEQSNSCNQLAAKYKHLKSLPLSSFNSSAPKLIIGMDNYFLTRPLKTIERSMDEPVATKTRVGWVVSGKCS